MAHRQTATTTTTLTNATPTAMRMAYPTIANQRLLPLLISTAMVSAMLVKPYTWTQTRPSPTAKGTA
jgi:hypothetical protein